VARSEEEAELQAAGINVVDQAAEEEAQAELEIAELFEDIGAAELDELETMDDTPAEDDAPAEEEAADAPSEDAAEDDDSAS
jgi:large subunit ribosomal protein L9